MAIVKITDIQLSNFGYRAYKDKVELFYRSNVRDNFILFGKSLDDNNPCLLRLRDPRAKNIAVYDEHNENTQMFIETVCESANDFNEKEDVFVTILTDNKYKNLPKNCVFGKYSESFTENLVEYSETSIVSGRILVVILDNIDGRIYENDVNLKWVIENGAKKMIWVVAVNPFSIFKTKIFYKDGVYNMNEEKNNVRFLPFDLYA